VISINQLIERAIIQQQIALNHRMYETKKISSHLYNRTHKILLGRLTKLASIDKITQMQSINHSEVIL